jgi:para-nitrobenzyl esterase
MKHLVLPLTVVLLMACSSMQQGKSSKNIDITAVNTEAGIVSGVRGGDGSVSIFKGIPFAAPPVGELRWKPPVPASHWEGIRKCDVFPPSAMQNKPAPFAMWTKEFMAPEEPLSEDCLYLNLWTAAKNSDEKRPVIVWIHGGAFTGGSGSVPLYDGEEMARKGVVFITINYRLGVFGFLAHPDLSKESPDKVSGNYGILDQIAALQWVRNNVAAFGGDPKRVTIAGQSAGSFSVNALMVSPLAKGLFHRAIGQSGGMFGREPGLERSLEEAEQAGLKFTASLNVTSLAELRKKTTEEVMKAGGRSGIVIDGYVIPPSYATFEAGKQHDVPLISGWNADDGVSFGPPAKAETFKAEAEKKYGEMTGEFLKLFPAGSDEEAGKSQKLQSVLAFGWQNYCWAAMQTKTGKNKAYLYFFTHVPPGEPNYGAFHSAEFGYALNNLKYWNKPFVDWDFQLADIMSSYWVNFAATGNPNGAGLPEWPAFTPQNTRVMEFGEKAGNISLPYAEQLGFIDRFQAATRSAKKGK